METVQNKMWNKNFNLVIIGQIISLFGSAMLRFALSLYVMDITGREDIFAGLFAISNIPILLSPLGGAIADRFNRRNLMVIFDFSSSFVVFIFILLLAQNGHSILLIGVVMVLLSVISAMYTPTVTASIPQLVEESSLAGANGIVQAVQALSYVVAPVCAGILYGMMSVQALIAVSGAAFFLSAVMEIFIRIPFVKRQSEGAMLKTIGRDMKEGFVFVAKQPFILKAMLIAALINFILTPLFVVGGPIILRMTMKSTDTVYGIGMGIIQFANILGALLIGVLASKIIMKKVYLWILAIAVILIPLALSVTPQVLEFGFYPSFVLFLTCAVPIAIIMTILSIYVITKVQKKTPNENLGKVMAIVMAVAQCVAPVGQVVYGFLFRTFHAQVYIPLLFVSAIMFGVTILSQRILRNENE